jgi:hypothetical protein
MTLRRKSSKTRKSRKCKSFFRPFFGGNQKSARIFLIDVDVNSKPNSSKKTKTCYPKDKKENNHNDPCHEPEWIYTPAGKKTNKVLCVTDKQKMEREMKKGERILDALQKTVDAIISKGGKVGDLVENVAESGYRAEGVYILKMKKKILVICPLDDDYDPYGHVGNDFTLGPEFPVGYWSFAFQKGAQISVTGDNLKSKASWHNGIEQAEPVDKKTINSIKQNQIKKSKTGDNNIDVTFPWGTLRFPYATLKEAKEGLTYKNNRVYFAPLEGEEGVASML